MLIYGVFQIQITTKQADASRKKAWDFLNVQNKYMLIFYAAHVMFEY